MAFLWRRCQRARWFLAIMKAAWLMRREWRDIGDMEVGEVWSSLKKELQLTDLVLLSHSSFRMTTLIGINFVALYMVTRDIRAFVCLWLNPNGYRTKVDDIGAQVLTMEDLGIGFRICCIPLALSVVVFIGELIVFWSIAVWKATLKRLITTAVVRVFFAAQNHSKLLIDVKRKFDCVADKANIQTKSNDSRTKC